MLNPVQSPLAVTHIQSLEHVTSHLDEADHEVNLDAVASHPLGIQDVGQGLTDAQKELILKRLDLEYLESMEDLPLTGSFMIEKTENLSVAESIQILKNALLEYRGDVNIPNGEFDLYERLLERAETADVGIVEPNSAKGQLKEKYYSDVAVKEAANDSSSFESSLNHPYSPYNIVDWETQIKLEAALLAYYSPYSEVRSVTEPFDDPSIPIETLRVYFLGLVWTCISAFVNQFFNDRQPSITLPSSVVQMFLYPCGMLLAKITPKWSFKIWKYDVRLNPGPWTFKEQMLCSLMFTVAGSNSYVGWNITVQKLDIFYANTWLTTGYEVLLLFSTNFMGIGFAGLLRKFVVYPTRCVWPTVLPNIALNKALLKPEKKENIHGWVISRYYFFYSVMAGSFLWYWIPDYLFAALSTFNWMTWIKPDNFNLAVITGSQLGMGINPIPSFDWNIISYSTPLVSPFYTTVNSFIGIVIGFFCIVGVYYSNYKWTAYLPINSNALFSNTGEPYVVQEVLNSDSLFDQSKYDQYGPPFYTAGNLVVYGAFFAMYPFAIIHEIAVSWRSSWWALKGLIKSFKSFKASTYDGYEDPHTVMMKKYKEVPDWVFLIVLLLSFMCAILCIKLFPTNTPVWSVIFVMAINLVFLIPITTIFATTNFSFGLNVLVELIVGYALPGNPQALIFIKALGYNIDGQADNYISDQKIGHYAKLPPRAMFRVQILGIFVGSLINLVAINFKVNHLSKYCHPHQKDKFTCPDSTTYFSSSVIWGAIGPKKVFGGLYPVLQWCFLIGFLLTIPCVLIRFYGPQRYVKYFQPTIIIGGMLSWAPYNLSYYTGGLYVSIAFMWYIKKRFSAWWVKYNYVLSSALGAGLAFSSIIIFFSVQYHPKNISWWGNNVPYTGIDGGIGRQSLLNASLHEGGYFGPRIGNYP